MLKNLPSWSHLYNCAMHSVLFLADNVGLSCFSRLICLLSRALTPVVTPLAD